MASQKRTHHTWLPRLRRSGRGQGLVEFALTLPLLLLVLAGILEVANLLLLYSRIELAGREAARFGALGGSNNGVRAVFLQGAEEGLERTPGILEVWVIRPVVHYNSSSQRFYWEGDTSGATWGSAEAEDECVYPASGCTHAQFILEPSRVLSKVTRYNASGTTDAADGDRYVIVAVYYQAKTILNLPVFRAGGDTGRFPLRSSSIFRQELSQETVSRLEGGCTAYPIALALDVRTPEGISDIRTAREGQKFLNVPFNETGNVPRSFDFLAWDNTSSAVGNPALQAALTKPGNSHLYYVDASDSSRQDTSLHRGDGVWRNNTATFDGASAKMAEHIAAGRTLRVILHSDLVNGSYYRINNSEMFGTAYGFAIIRPTAYASGMMSFEFIRFDNSCGEPVSFGD